MSESAVLPTQLARVMVGRGIDNSDDAQRYLEPRLQHLPDPSRLKDMEAATDRLVYALKANETVGIFGDYDVDGVTSTTLMMDVIESFGGSVTATVPDRLVEGYGLSRAGVDRLVDGGAKLIVTVDCGVTAREEVAYAKSRNVDVIVIDHHTVPVELPAAIAVINPHRDDDESGGEHLCAVGVTFNLCLALRRTLRERGYFERRDEPDLRNMLDLVALGTVADVVPLIEDNRAFVQFGLKVIARDTRVGMSALLDVARLDRSRLSGSSLGFQLGPRINAAGRLGDAMKAVELLRSTHPMKAKALAEKLDDENLARRDMEKRIVEQASQQIEEIAEFAASRVLVVGSEDWHPGVVGIVASRLVDKFGKPCVVVGAGGRGSGRSIPRFHLHEALASVEGTLEGFGGHAHAAGVKVPAGGLEQFRTAMVNHAQGVLSDDDLGRTLLYDGVLELEHLDEGLINSLRRGAPFGRANPEPVFRIPNVRPRAMRELNGGHVKAVLDRGRNIEAIYFGAADRMQEFDSEVELLAVPEINEWRGTRRVQLRVRDFKRKSEGVDGTSS
ncbi:MAG: single-stranded-DNA-specific exonuclease RecJ [Deltaproteobacteria bacterium]|nr:single-stranded-DNA-specific exonuclease RecJ [Deltaproteobacteria bacterium]